MIGLKTSFGPDRIEAGLDEAGRGCLAGPVVAAAVILDGDHGIDGLNDSKKLTARKRELLRGCIEEEAAAWSVCAVWNEEIDEVNILNASIRAMHRALDALGITPELLLVDGNRFKHYRDIEHRCIVRGDAKYQSIAAASILAKTHRDELMERLHCEYKQYDWRSNKGYPTKAHRENILRHGISPYHRRSFKLFPVEQLEMFGNRK